MLTLCPHTLAKPTKIDLRKRPQFGRTVNWKEDECDRQAKSSAQKWRGTGSAAGVCFPTLPAAPGVRKCIAGDLPPVQHCTWCSRGRDTTRGPPDITGVCIWLRRHDADRGTT